MNERAPLETHLLETFVEVVRRGSVTAAAEQLNRSQPAISHRLRALEERFDVGLFEKIGRQLELTEYGERLFEQSLALLLQLEGLHESVVGQTGTVAGTVTLGTFPTVARHLLVEAVEALLGEHEQLRLNFRFGVASEQVDLLRSGRVDMLVFVGDVDTTGLEATPLGKTRLVAAMAPSLAPKNGLKISDLEHLRYLAWSGPSDPTFDTAYRYATRHELVDSRTPQIPHIETLRALAHRGVGFTILPHYTTLRDVEESRLVTFPLPDFQEEIPIYFLTREQSILGPGLRVVKRTIVAKVGELL